MKKTLLISSALCAAITYSVVAQDTAPPAAAETPAGDAPVRPPAPEPGQPMNKEQLEYSINFVQEHINTRQERADAYVADIERLDDRIEKGIDKILGMVSGIIDSTDSKYRVSFLKIEIMEGLHNTILYYDRKRRALQEEERQRNPSISRDTLAKAIGAFDDRVEKRVEQIVTLAKTMPGYDSDLERLKRTSSSGWWGDNRTLYTRNDKYYQNRREGARTQKTQKQIVEELKASIDRHDRIIRDINQTLKQDITPQFREFLTEESNRSASIIENRQAQIESLVTNPAKPGGKKIGSQQTRNIENLIKDMIQDLRRDFFNMFEIYTSLTAERQAIQTLNVQLAGYQTQLKELNGGGTAE